MKRSKQNKAKKVKDKFLKIKYFFKEGIWMIDAENLPWYKRVGVKSLQVTLLAIMGFREDRLNMHASALTFFTMLSIVPVVALGFGIAKGFNLENVLEDELKKNMAGQQEVTNYIITFTHSMLDNAKGGLIAGIGLGLLLWSVMKLLINIENTFNDIWEIKKSRSLVRKLTDYFSIMLFSPIVMVLSSSTTVFMTTQFKEITTETAYLSFATPLFLESARIVPYFIISALFTMLYLVMPNTKVHFKSAIIAGVLAGVSFQVFQGLYIYVQASASRVSAIYGSFAALPLFLIWLQISWLIVLFGAEVAFAVQNLRMKGASARDKDLSIVYQKKIALLIVKTTADIFKSGKKALNIAEISQRINTPHYTVKSIMKTLQKAGIMAAIKPLSRGKNYLYQPAQSVSRLSVMTIIEAYENLGEDKSNFIKNKKINTISEKMKYFNDTNFNDKENKLLTDI